MVNEIAAAYHAGGLGVNGAGQVIGIVIDTFPASSDLTLFWQSNAIAQSLQHPCHRPSRICRIAPRLPNQFHHILNLQITHPLPLVTSPQAYIDRNFHAQGSE